MKMMLMLRLLNLFNLFKNNFICIFNLLFIDIMKTGVWKVVLKEGKRDKFMNSYNVFKQAPGFVSCYFYPVIEDKNTLFAVEIWESDEAHKSFMGSLPKEAMGELFSMIDGKPEAYNCETAKVIAK